MQIFTAIKTLWVMQDVCWNFLKPAILTPGQGLHRAHVAGMQLCSSDVVFNILLIAQLQQHDPAREQACISRRQMLHAGSSMS